MNRLQKKCLIAAAGTHLLLVVLLLCSGFITSKPKTDDSQVLDVIPAKLIDALASSGVKNAQPPPPTPIVKPPEPPPPTPEPPKPVVTPPPKPEPVTPPEGLKSPDAIEPKPKPKPHTIEVNLKPVMHKTTPTVDNSAEEKKAAEAAEKEAKRLAEAKARAFRNAARSIRENTSTSTTIDMPGDSTVAYANYASVVKSRYTQAWIPPDDTASDDANVKVSVTIANDGTVISAHIIAPSGDKSVDNSVQKTLDRVHDIAPFPDGATDKERTYIINFNLKAKRMLG
jgi:TonB family protein